MGNKQFKISDIENSESRRDLEQRIEQIYETQNELEKTQKILDNRISEVNQKDTDELRITMIAYFKCVHMNSIRRSLFHSEECDKAVMDLVGKSFDAIENTGIKIDSQNISKGITALRGNSEE